MRRIMFSSLVQYLVIALACVLAATRAAKGADVAPLHVTAAADIGR
jgi:hypothetical protein